MPGSGEAGSALKIYTGAVREYPILPVYRLAELCNTEAPVFSSSEGRRKGMQD